MSGVWIVTAAVVFLVLRGSWEALVHRRNLRRIPVRIHVNGTRGKSSVTRLIAASLREAGITTMAKTTGTLPRLILPDGSEQPINRPARPNVIEQVPVVRAAAACEAQALVVECMALQPQLQSLCERKLVQATHGAITNARPDHLDVMGPTPDNVARALANVTPHRGKLFTAENTHLEIFRDAAKDRRSALVHVAPDDVVAVTDDEMAQFSYVEHRENVALALRVCQDLGVDRSTALRGMWKCQPDPGASTTHEVDFFGRRIVFVNALAANDPDSTRRMWRRSLEQFPDTQQRIVLVNCRADRLDRSWQLGQECSQWRSADRFVVTGTGTQVFTRSAARAGMNRQQFVIVDDPDVTELFETLVSLAGRSALVVGIGNIGCNGLEIVRYFRNRSVLEPAVPAMIRERMTLEPQQQTGSEQRLRRRVIEAACSDTGNSNGNGNGHTDRKLEGQKDD